MVTDQNHSSDSTHSEEEVFRYERIVKRIADMDSALSEKMGALDEKMDNYYSEYKKSVKRLERDVRSIENELDVIDDCVGRETVVDLIHEIVPALISEKDQKKNKDFIYTSESSEDSDSGEIVEEPHGYQVRGKKTMNINNTRSINKIIEDALIATKNEIPVPHKQRRKARPRKVKQMVV
jgi:hypothetical protein